METKNIGIDLDGVLGDFVTSMMKEALETYSIIIDPEKITAHDLTTCTPLTKPQMKKILGNEDVFKRMKPFLFAPAFTHYLHDAGWTIHVVTDRMMKMWGVTYTWLMKNGFVWEHMYLCPANRKPIYAKAEKISVFIEDRLDTALALADICDTMYLMDKSYNQGELPKNVIRVFGFGAVKEFMEGGGKEIRIERWD